MLASPLWMVWLPVKLLYSFWAYIYWPKKWNNHTYLVELLAELNKGHIFFDRNASFPFLLIEDSKTFSLSGLPAYIYIMDE